jgi:hypothetical protein
MIIWLQVFHKEYLYLNISFPKLFIVFTIFFLNFPNNRIADILYICPLKPATFGDEWLLYTNLMFPLKCDNRQVLPATFT